MSKRSPYQVCQGFGNREPGTCFRVYETRHGCMAQRSCNSFFSLVVEGDHTQVVKGKLNGTAGLLHRDLS